MDTNTDNRLILEDGEHSKLGASGADRWMNCVGSVQLIDNIAASLNAKELVEFHQPGEPASEGTAAHAIAAMALEQDKEAWEFIGLVVVADGLPFIVDQEMADGVQVHLDLVDRLMKQYAEEGARLYVEEKLSSFLDPDAWGTSDTIIFVPGVKIIVIDFKYGRVVVEPDSAQNKEYGYMACEGFEDSGIEDVELWITQPRAPHPKGRTRPYSTTRAALEEWFIGEVVPAMAATRELKANLTIGPWCRFCKAKEKCPAMKGETLNLNMDLEPEYMTGEELGTLMQRGDAINKYMAKLGEEAFKRVKAGEAVTGYKLVYKMANRIWKDKAEAALEKAFGTEAYTEPKLLTPPAVEKLTGGKKLVARWAFSPKNKGLTIAKESDTREAVVVSGAEFFGEEAVDV
jgi:hypothetical protein